MGFQQPSPQTDKVFDAARRLEYKVNILKKAMQQSCQMIQQTTIGRTVLTNSL